MKTIPSLAAALALSFPLISLAADEAACCKMMSKPAPPPPPPAASCCCAKMAAAKDTPTPAADLAALLEKARTARGEELPAALAALLNKLSEERKAPVAGEPAAPPPAAHQH